MSANPTTIDEQINILKRRGLDVGSNPGKYLIQYGYYNLINGYKDLFIDSELTRQAKEDRYKHGTSLNHLIALYEYDAKLRHQLMAITINIETQLKSLISLHFSLSYGYGYGCGYDLPSNFTPAPKQKKHVTSLIDKLQDDVEDAYYYKRTPTICHYMNNYQKVPLWVLNTIISFGEMSKFYNNLKANMRRNIAADINPNLKSDDLSSALRYLTTIRNKSAHNNRLFSHKKDQQASRVSTIPEFQVHKDIGIAYRNNRYLYGQDDILAAFIVSSVISKQTEIFHIQYQNIDNDLNKLSKQIPNETVMQIREITGLKSEYLSKLTRYEF